MKGEKEKLRDEKESLAEQRKAVAAERRALETEEKEAGHNHTSPATSSNATHPTHFEPRHMLNPQGTLCCPRHRHPKEIGTGTCARHVIQRILTSHVYMKLALCNEASGGCPALDRGGVGAVEDRVRAARGGQGRALQVDPMNPILNPPAAKHLKLKCDKLL
jgi:hypothetical protein